MGLSKGIDYTKLVTNDLFNSAPRFITASKYVAINASEPIVSIAGKGVINSMFLDAETPVRFRLVVDGLIIFNDFVHTLADTTPIFPFEIRFKTSFELSAENTNADTHRRAKTSIQYNLY